MPRTAGPDIPPPGDPPDPDPPPRHVQLAVRYRTLALLWFFPSLGAIGILAREFRGPPASPHAGQPAAWLALEFWVALILLATHFALGIQAWRSRHHYPAPNTSTDSTPTRQT